MQPFVLPVFLQKTKKIMCSIKADNAFTKDGYRNWKKALEKDVGFSEHECSENHKQAKDCLFTAPKTAKGDIGDLLICISIALMQKTKNRVKHFCLKSFKTRLDF